MVMRSGVLPLGHLNLLLVIDTFGFGLFSAIQGHLDRFILMS